MSTEIKLRFESFTNPDLDEKLGEKREFIRLFCAVKIKGKDGWMDSCDAIVDTGAPMSVIPLDLWTDAETEILTEHEIRGISPRKECAVPALVGNVRVVLLDENSNRSDAVAVTSYLALTNRVPLIVGFRDLLERYDLFFSYVKNDAWIRME